MTRLRSCVGVFGALLLVAGLVAGGSAFASPPLAAHAATVPTVHVAPSTSTPGGEITVWGSGFAPNEPVEVLLSPQKAGIAEPTADSNGNVSPVALRISATAFGPGSHTLTLFGSVSHRTASIALPLATIATITPTTIAEGGTLRVSGAGFAPNEPVEIVISPQSSGVAEPTADADGVVAPTSIILNPAHFGPGVHTLTLYGSRTRRQATAQFTVIAPGPSLTITPATVTAGGQVVVAGTGFVPNEVVAVLVSPRQGPVLDIRADANGVVPSTPITLSASTFTPGVHTVHLYGSSSRRIASAQITITPAATSSLTVTPTTTNRGGVVTVSGSGFSGGEVVTLSISSLTSPLASARVDYHGTLAPTGISIPYSLAPGSYTLTATGTTSKRSGSATITVAALVPSITISNPTASPGTIETVRGMGFGAHEQITLSLNGEALATTPAVITTTDGSFSATFTAPSSLLRGANAISALGNESRVSGVATLTGMLTRAAEFYFSGGQNAPGVHSFLALLNPNKQAASVRLTFYFDNGASYTRLISVPPTTLQHLAIADYGLQSGTFGLEIKADRQLAAQLDVMRDGMDGAVLLANSALNTRWYLAGGSTRGTFQERVSLLNPDPTQPTQVTLHLITSTGPSSRTILATVPAHTDKEVNINHFIANQAVSIVVTADRPIAVERTLTFGIGGRALTMLTGSNRAAVQWLFADGTTENNVQTAFTVLNPGPVAARVTATFSQQKGLVLGSRTIVVGPQSRATITLNQVVQGGGIATVVTSDQPIVVERAEYIGGGPDKAPAASVVTGRNGTATRWSFPGGNTVVGNDEVLDLYNPSAVTVPITATFYGAQGRIVTEQVTLAPTERTIIPVNVLGLSVYHSAILQTSASQGFIAEQGISRHDSTLLTSTQGLAQ